MTTYLKQFLFLGLLFFMLPISKALPTFIEGKVINGNGLVIRVSAYSDQISFQENLLDMYEVKSDENFELGFEIADIQEIFVHIGNQTFSFFAEEGRSYQLKIENVEIPPKSAISEQKPLHLFWSKRNALDEAIDNFNYTFSSFVEENFVALYKYRDSKLLQSFEDETETKLKETTNLSPKEKIFFKNFIAYQLADLKNASHTVSDLKLGETYFKNAEILYNNPAYMLFFNHYFAKYFVTGRRNTNYHEFIKLIGNGNNISKLIDYLGQDPILIQERLRELVLLNALKEVYYNKDFNALQIKILIEEITKNSKFTEHKKIGAAIISQLSGLQIGAIAPIFKLKSTQGNYKSLSDYKGRYIYLIFTSDNCQACESDRVALEKIHEKYKKDIAVVEVFVNYTKNGLIKYTNKTKASWDRLLFNNNFDLLNSYRIRTYPLYILLDRENKILLNPAKKPHEGIDRYFDFIIKRDAHKEEKQDVLFR